MSCPKKFRERHIIVKIAFKISLNSQKFCLILLYFSLKNPKASKYRGKILTPQRGVAWGVHFIIKLKKTKGGW